MQSTANLPVIGLDLAKSTSARSTLVDAKKWMIEPVKSTLLAISS
jgi:hypothetical protein